MNFLIDGVLLLIIIITIYVYYRMGFVKAILGLGKAIISYVCAAFFGKKVGVLLAEGYFDEKITNLVYNMLNKRTDALGKISIPQALRTVGESCGINMDDIAASLEMDPTRLQGISETVGTGVSAVVSSILGYIIVFAVAYLVLLLGAFILEAVVELPVIRTVNHILGMCIGIISAVIFAFIFVYAIKAVTYYVTASGGQSDLLEAMDKTYLFKFISEFGRG